MINHALTAEEETRLLQWESRRERAAIQAEGSSSAIYSAEQKPHSEEPQAGHKFTMLTEDHFKLVVPEIQAEFEVDRLRRERGALLGELIVRCRLPGVRSFGGVVSAADFNLTSTRTRSDLARMLATRVDGAEIDWHGCIEELCQRVLSEERKGQPAVDLRTIPGPEKDDSHYIDGLVLPRRHPSIIFGDGGCGKSLVALFLLCHLAMRGLRVALFDWELDGADHRIRLGRLFGGDMPHVSYVKCGRPLIYEADRLARVVRENQIDYAVFDSIAFACSGPPESAETANAYFQAVRKIGVGSLHIAHIAKSEGSDQKPFGSAFFHNGARCTYYAKADNTSVNGKEIIVGLYNRKANLSGLHPPTGFTIRFEDDRTIFAQSHPGDSPELADKLSISERLYHVLQSGDQDIDDLAEEFDVKAQSIRNAATRGKRLFVIRGGKIGLAY